MQDFLCGNFNLMNQRRYLVNTILILLVLLIGYIIVRKISGTKETKKPIVIFNKKDLLDSLPNNISMGKKLYELRCMSCHSSFKKADGASLMLRELDLKWPDRKELYAFIRNPAQVVLRNKYAKRLRETYNVMMPGFPDLTDIEIKAILDYIKSEEKISG